MSAPTYSLGSTDGDARSRTATPRGTRTVPSVTSMRGISLSTRRRPDALLALAVSAVVLAGSALEGSVDGIGGALLLVLCCAPLALSRAHPATAAALVVAALVVTGLLAEPGHAMVIPLILALYLVGLAGPRRRTAALACMLIPVVITVVLVLSPEDGSPPAQVLEIMAWLTVGLVFGEAVRSQRAFVDAVAARARQAERVRIARDVHDVVAHTIAAVNTQASVGLFLSKQEPGRSVEALEVIKDVSGHALEDLRLTLGVLREEEEGVPLTPTPQLDQVAALVERARQAGVDVELRLAGPVDGVPLPLQVAGYRIAQEALTNAMRHASGAGVQVAISADEEALLVEVANDDRGSAATDARAGAGRGLLGMRERAIVVGGRLDAGASEDGGFRVRAMLPLRGPAVR